VLFRSFEYGAKQHVGFDTVRIVLMGHPVKAEHALEAIGASTVDHEKSYEDTPFGFDQRSGLVDPAPDFRVRRRA